MKTKCFVFFLICVLLLAFMLPLSMKAEAAVEQSTFLFFDFSNIDDHSGSQYGGWDFGTTNLWGVTGGTSDTLEINRDSGTLTINRTDPNAYTYFYAQTWNGDSTTRYPLSYDPQNAEYLQVRMKISGFEAAGKTTRFCLNYYINGSTAQQMDGATHSFGEGFAFDGSYMTLRMKLSDAFRSADVVNGVKLNFWNMKGTGSVAFDYVYIGPEAGLPGETPLYFDFRNTTADQTRYSSDTYGGVNFDTVSPWVGTYLSGSAKDTIAVNNTQGTMTLTKTASNGYSYCYAMNRSHLRYRPEQAEYLQMGLKLSGFKVATDKSSFSLNYYTNGTGTQYTDAATYKFEKGFVFEGEYLTITIPLSKAFVQCEVVSQIKLNFWNLEGTGTAVFDYIYIGSKEGLPSKDYLRFGYVSSEGQGVVAQQNCRITAGVTETTVKLNDEARSNQAVGFLTTIEPDAQISFKASYSGYYTKGSTPESRAALAPNLPWKLERTTSQAAAYEAATGGKVLLATNADFYNVTTYQPKGYMIMEGNVLQTYDSRQQPFFAVLKDGTIAIRDFGAPTADVAEAVSGVWLVKDGKNVTDTYYHSTGYKSNQPMNAIGMTADGTIHIFVVDGRQSPYSMGMDVNDLSNLFVSLGCVNAIDLDGGGSATYASVHEGTQTLRVRNSPSDGNERAISNALLMISTAGQCDHSYNKNYVINTDGTHTVSCSKCTSKINSGHLYTNKRCACGDVEEQPSCLYFNFGNTAADRDRYLNSAYGYWNFDNPTGNPWPNSNWSTANNGDKRNHYRIDNTQGLLIADVTDSGIGPRIAPTNAYGVFPWFIESFYKYFPLNYVPKNGEYFQIRFKTDNCSSVEGKIPRVDLQYCSQKDGVYKAPVDGVVDFSLQNGVYQTFTAPLAASFRNEDVLYDFTVRFQNITSTGGSVSIDYIYIGPRADLPTPLHRVTFVDGNGKTLQTQFVQNGNSASYTGAAPTRNSDGEYHYSFKSWDKALTNITADTVITALFTAKTHSYSFSFTDSNTHKATCSCGYSKSENHTIVIEQGVAPTCTETGLTEGEHCPVCKAVLTAQETVPETGHTPVYTSKDADAHTVNCENCDYIEEAPHTYTDGKCICGQIEVKEPVEASTWKLGHSLNLASDISVNYAIAKASLADFDADTVYILAEQDTYEGNTKTGVKTFKLYPTEQGNYYYFTLNGLTAVNMNDEIRAVLYAAKDGQVHYSPVDDYSIATYAYAQMNKATAPQKLKNLCAELLRYGGKAQSYKSYRLDSLADANMTDVHRAYLRDIEAVAFGTTNNTANDLENAPIKWQGKALDLASKVTIKFIFSMGSYTGDISDLTLRVIYEDIHGNPKTLTLSNGELYNSTYQFYAFTLDSLLAAELRCVLSVQIYAGDAPVSCTMEYAADTYGNNKTGALGELCKALFAYVDRAKAYFSNS